ncbi:hypothetical protein M0R19_03700 [Candidatus Pacearchaeota archaeon]|jgi:RNA ligase|nr:hypothetical protein [Candidatus Pacearchaeota archaeon]
MSFLDKIDLDLIEQYNKDKLISIVKHDTEDLLILNYTNEASYSRSWDLYTESCRGLVIDNKGNIVSRPFKKFFNYEELSKESIDKYSHMKYEVYEKIDGSFIEIFKYNGKNIISTRGTFFSSQALLAKEIFERKINETFDFIKEGKTYCFELIHPTNRIVVNYGDIEDLILLSIIDVKTGKEESYSGLFKEVPCIFSVVNRFDFSELVNDIKDLKKFETKNKEGFVLKFEDNYRIKLKFDEYVRLHRIAYNFSNKVIWECLRNNSSLEELKKNLPEESYTWFEKTKDDLIARYNDILCEVKKEFNDIIQKVSDINDKKEFALYAVKSKYKGILFNIYDKHNFSKLIWNLIEPKYERILNEKPCENRKLNKYIFREYDIRGNAEKDLDSYTIKCIGGAIGSMMLSDDVPPR